MLKRRVNHGWRSARGVAMVAGLLGVVWLLGGLSSELPALRRYLRIARM